MSKSKFKLNKKGVRELLQSKEMANVLDERATAIQQRCGAGYEKSAYTGKTRVNVSVYAATAKAKRDNKKNNTLLKAVK